MTNKSIAIWFCLNILISTCNCNRTKEIESPLEYWNSTMSLNLNSTVDQLQAPCGSIYCTDQACCRHGSQFGCCGLSHGSQCCSNDRTCCRPGTICCHYSCCNAELNDCVNGFCVRKVGSDSSGCDSLMDFKRQSISIVLLLISSVLSFPQFIFLG